MKLLNILLELNFDVSTTEKYKWDLKLKEPTLYEYEFNTSEDNSNGIDYVVSFNEHDSEEGGSGIFERIYRPKGKDFKMTGEGKAFKINATVMDTTLHFMKNNKYWNILLISPLEQKRHTLVKAFLDKNISKNLYDLEDDGQNFTIRRKIIVK